MEEKYARDSPLILTYSEDNSGTAGRSPFNAFKLGLLFNAYQVISSFGILLPLWIEFPESDYVKSSYYFFPVQILSLLIYYSVKAKYNMLVVDLILMDRNGEIDMMEEKEEFALSTRWNLQTFRGSAVFCDLYIDIVAFVLRPPGDSSWIFAISSLVITCCEIVYLGLTSNSDEEDLDKIGSMVVPAVLLPLFVIFEPETCSDMQYVGIGIYEEWLFLKGEDLYALQVEAAENDAVIREYV